MRSTSRSIGLRFRAMLDQDAPRADDLREHAFVLIVTPIGPVHDERPTATVREFADVESIRESGRTPPTCQHLRIAERCKDVLRRCADLARRFDCFHAFRHVRRPSRPRRGLPRFVEDDEDGHDCSTGPKRPARALATLGSALVRATRITLARDVRSPQVAARSTGVRCTRKRASSARKSSPPQRVMRNQRTAPHHLRRKRRLSLGQFAHGPVRRAPGPAAVRPPMRARKAGVAS